MLERILGSLLWIMVASQAGGDAWGWAISYVIVSHAFENNQHFNPAITLYKVLAKQSQDPIQGFFWLVMQILAAYVGGHLTAALGMTADSCAGFEIGSWKDGVQEMLAVAFYVWIHLQNADNDNSDMPSAVVSILSIVVAFWLAGDNAVFAANRQFVAFNTNFWVAYLWGAVGSVVAAFKYAWYTE
jgi:hypothetical protein